MATITGLTAEKMAEIAAATIVSAEVVGNHLILTTEGGTTIDAGDISLTFGTGTIPDVLGDRVDRRLDLIFRGDSITYGAHVSDLPGRFPILTQNKLRAARPSPNVGTGGGSGYIPARDPSALFTEPTVIGTPTSSGNGFGRESWILANDGDAVEYHDVQGTSIDVWLAKWYGTGAVIVEIDGPVDVQEGHIGPFTNTDYLWCNGVTNLSTIGASDTLDLVAWVDNPDWTPATTQSICGWQDGFRMQLGGTGSGFVNKLMGAVRSGGSAKTAIPPSATGWTDGTGRFVRQHLDMAADTITYYYSDDTYVGVDDALAECSWTMIGSPIALSAAIASIDSVGSAVIGNNSTIAGGAGWLGTIRHAAGYINGSRDWGGPINDKPDGAYFWHDGEGRRWNSSTVAGGGGTNEGYLKIAQDDPGSFFLSLYGDLSTPDVFHPTSDRINVPLPDSSPHDILITKFAEGIALTPGPAICGIDPRDGDEFEGINCIGAAQGGYQAFHFVGAGLFYQLEAQSEITQGTIHVYFFGTNEYGNNVDPSNYNDSLSLMLDSDKASIPDLLALVITGWEPEYEESPGEHDFSEYRNEALSLISDRDWCYNLDLYESWPRPGSVEGDASGRYSDGTHLTDLGADLLADEVSDFILGGLLTIQDWLEEISQTQNDHISDTESIHGIDDTSELLTTADVLDNDAMTGATAVNIPSAESVVAYVTSKVAGLLDYKGGYNASTNSPDLDSSPSGVLKGDTYRVTTAGTFFSAPLSVGDAIIAEIDNPTVEADWTILQGDLPADLTSFILPSSTTQSGIAELATVAEGIAGTDNARIMTPEDVRAAMYAFNLKGAPALAIAENYKRAGARIVNATGPGSGILHLAKIDLPLGLLITKIGVRTGVTAGNPLTHSWMGIYDNASLPVALRMTADQTTATWTAQTDKILTLSSTFTTTYSGDHYLGLCCVGTVPTLHGVDSSAAGPIAKTPMQAMTCESGLTVPTTPGASVGSGGFSAAIAQIYFWLE